MTSFNFLLKLLESRKVRASSDVKDIDNPLQLGLLKLDIQDIQVGSSACPVLDLIKRACAFSALLRILVASYFLDLSSPVDNS